MRVTCRRLKSNIEIFVDDDGPGVRPDAFEKVFERFYTDRPHQGFGQNSGLGLSISKQIVDAHGGAIWVENRIGAPDADGTPAVAGARFIVRLAGDVMAARFGDRARLGRAGWRARGADPRTFGIRQIAACARTARSGTHRLSAVREAGRRRSRPSRSCRRPLAGAPGRGAGGPDRGARRRTLHRMPHEPRAVVGLVIDLAAADAERLPDADRRKTEIGGIELPRLASRIGCGSLARRARPHQFTPRQLDLTAPAAPHQVLQSWRRRSRLVGDW